MSEEEKADRTEEPAGREEPSAPTSGDGSEPRRSTSSRLWTPYGEQAAGDAEPRRQNTPAAGEEEISDEELRKRIEEAMEKITVADVVVDMMVSLSSLAYQKMGLPKEVNEKYRDLEQARLAIDCLDAMLASLSGRVPGEHAKALTGTLDNLKLNFAKES